MLLLFCLFQRPKLIENFEKLQKQKALENLDRSRDVILTELTALEKQSQDWGSWDDTYKYAADRNPAFKTTNLIDSTFTVSHFDIIWILDSKSNIVYGKSRLPSGKFATSMEGFDAVQLAEQNIKRGTKVDQGINMIAGFPTVLCVRPILNSKEIGASHGTLILGRYLTKQVINSMNKSTHVSFKLLSPDSATGVLTNPLIAQQLNQKRGNFVEDPTTTKSVDGFTLLENTQGVRSVMIHALTNPDILNEGTESVQQALNAMIAISVVATILGLCLISFTVSKPLTILAKKVEDLSDLSFVEFDSAITNRQDEIGTVAQSFKDLICRLEKAQLRIMNSSRDAGMAEVARGILHNAGNVLNSTVVSAEQISQVVADSDPAGFKLAIQLLEQNQGNLDAYLSSDPKGSKLLPYLTALAENLEAKHVQIQSECAALMTSTNHLGAVVRGQEALARKENNICKFHLSGITNEVASILESSLKRHGVTLEIFVDESHMCVGDPGKLTQVLINLVVNAKEALVSQRQTEKQIVVKSQYYEKGAIEIQICDNGPGISINNLENVFKPGFSTKAGGTGHGLHYCANSLTEMGWSISANSKGEGQGSNFTISSPHLESKEKAA
jgi:two-component system, NtrC family, sensor kinase